MKVLAFDDKVLAFTSDLGFGLERKVLATYVVRVCSAHSRYRVTEQSAISCSGIFHRLACKLDVGCKIIRICEVRAV